MVKRLKPVWRNVFATVTKDTDAALDALIVPDIKEKIIEPILKSFPYDKDWTPDEAKNQLSAIINNFTANLQAGKQPVPMLLAIVFGIVSLALPFMLAPALTPITEKYITRNIRKGVRSELLTAEEYFNAWLRGEYKEEDLDARLAQIGLESKDIKAIKTILMQIPSASDVIRFAVREVYKPETIAKFRMSEGFEEVQALGKEDIRKAGLTPETLNKYWLAHWDLPSAQMGYEMLHRNIINKDELMMLLTALDVMPFWRDKLVDMSYDTFTRVDIRRMHKLGILTDADLVKSYMEIGYDKTKAEQLAAFTIQYNADTESSEQTDTDKKKAQFKELTKSDILKGYNQSMISRSDAKSMIESINFDSDDAEFLLAREDYLKSIDDAEKLIKQYHDAYIRGVYDKKKIVELLGKLNIPSSYQDYLIESWDIEITVKGNIPTKSEILGFYKRKTIDELTAREELKKLGYSERYINWYMQGTTITEEQT